MYRTSDESGQPVASVPESCTVRIELNDEPFLDVSVYPSGSAEPYRIDSGFRFPAPIGLFSARLAYSRCRGTAEADRDVAFYLTVATNQVTSITFDGDSVDARAPSPDSGVTLQSLDARLQRIERALNP
jgi:hypothetical protein